MPAHAVASRPTAARRRSSPLSLLATEVPGFVMADVRHGTYEVAGRHVSVEVEPGIGLRLVAHLADATAGRLDDLELLCQQREVWGLAKFSSENERYCAVAEAPLLGAHDVAGAFHAAAHTLGLALGIGAEPKRRSPATAEACHAPAEPVVEQVESALAEVGVEFRRRGEGWAASRDTRRFLHHLSISTQGTGLATVRFEARGEPVGVGDGAAAALGRYLLGVNAALRVARLSVVRGEGNDECVVVPEAVVPVAQLNGAVAKAAVEALVVAADHTRAEVEALCHECVAQEFLRLCGRNHSVSGREEVKNG